MANERGISRRGLLGGAAAAASAFGLGAVAPRAARAATGPATSRQRTSGADRLQAAYESRLEAAERLLARGMPDPVSNGDEARYPSRFASFTKGLPHDGVGEVDRDAFDALVSALESGEPGDFEAIPLAGVRKLVNPQAGIAFDTEGADPQQLVQPPAPRFDSAEEAGEMVELYWMALLRDVPFVDYETRPLVQRAIAEIDRLSDFRGPRQGGHVTVRTLFRDVLPKAAAGPYLSQFLLLGTPFGAEYVERRMRTLLPGSDHVTDFDEWLEVQNGRVPGSASYDPTRRFIRSGRDLAEWVHIDVLFQAYFNACLILGSAPDAQNRPTRGGLGCPPNPGNPYLDSLTQDGFGTWGAPAFKSLLCEVATRALKAVWFQKWLVHRRLRPEEFAGRVHVRSLGHRDYPIHGDLLDSDALGRIRKRFGGSLLPLVFPEGSPIHPSYGAGHATVAGACVTVLKALFDERFVIRKPVVAAADGKRLLPWSGEPLTVGGELDKLASNVATGRNIAGVHWRTDAYASLRLGEQVAIDFLQDHLPCFNEGGSCRFTSFDGQTVEI